MIAEWMVDFAAHAVPGVILGLYALRFYSVHAPSNGETSWPTIPAVSMVVGTLGSALSFLLVFWLSWTFAAWRAGRDQVGDAASRLVQLSVLLHTGVVPSGAPASGRALALEFDAAAARYFDAIVYALRYGSDAPLDRSATAHGRVLASHVEIVSRVRRGVETGLLPKHAPPLDVYAHLSACLLAYNACLRKKTARLPVALQLLLWGLKTSYSVLIFPQAVAYLFIMALKADEVEASIVWTTPVFVAAYLLAVVLNILYFTGIYLVAKHLQDPFGAEASDVDLHHFRAKLGADLSAVSKAVAADAGWLDSK